MLKKFVIALAAISFVLSQGTIFAPRPAAAENAEMIELASVLPESDIVLAMDFDRTLNVAAANVLQNDAEKIEHLKSVMKTVENQIGFSPYEVKQIAVGIKLPPGGTKDSFDGFDFAAIVRTNLPNVDLLDVWSRRMENIFAFNEEKAPTRVYVEEFRRFRDRKFTRATPEKIAASVKNLEDALKKTQALDASVDALPKTSVAPAALKAFKDRNRNFAATLNKYIRAFKADTDAKNYRAETIRLLNRWNALAADDPQRAAKLAAIKKESEAIYPAYKKKFAAAEKIERIFERIEADRALEAPDAPDWSVSISEELDRLADELGSLPATKIKRTAALNALGERYVPLNAGWEETFESAAGEEPETPEMPIVETTAGQTAKGFYESMKQARRERTVNGKRLVLIDVSKLNPPPVPGRQEPPGEIKNGSETTEKPAEAITVASETSEKQTAAPNIAVGFLDQNRIIIGLEKSVTAVLRQDASYKNQKAAAMLDTAKPALFAFAVNSTVARKVSDEMAKTAGKTNAPSTFDGFLKDVSLYGSVNYEGSNPTNDITMTLGFARDNVDPIPAPAVTGADADTTFEIGGYQFGKALFYDLFNSFKAMQASVTFKFEKKKVSSLLKATPRIFDQLADRRGAAKNKAAKRAQAPRVDSVQDLLTAPQIYVDLVKLFESRAG
ncbi:MAG TPA: hypothetical protein VIL74_01180 [Pyrinomonadaceae bacterium]|jgi:hypothetical protein